MYWTYELNVLCGLDKRAHVRMKNGEEFDCIPDSLVYDDDDSEIMAVRQLPSERMRLLPENEIESVTEIK